MLECFNGLMGKYNIKRRWKLNRKDINYKYSTQLDSVEFYNCFIFVYQFYSMVSAFSVPKSKRQQKITDVPGPGQYNPQNTPKVLKPSDPKYSFGKQGRKHMSSFVPGPGAYEVKESYVIQKKPSFTMLSRRQLRDSKVDVGPGQYEPKYSFAKQKSPAYSMKGRSMSTLEAKPGPGQYDSISQFQKKGGKSFGRDSRIQQYGNKIPGPGSYDFENAVFKYGSKQQPAYGFGSRIQMKNNSSYIPGPGEYEPKKQVYSKIGGIMARDMHSSLVLSKTPGPGSYDDSSYSKLNSKDPMWSLSKSSRQNMYKSNEVGPGQYDHDKNYKKVVTSSPAYNFGSDKRDIENKSISPGPGAYDQTLMKSRMSIKIGQKPKDLSSSFVPGPGAYEADKYNKEAWLKGQGRYSLGKSARDFAHKSEVPGPGAYDKNTNILEPNGKVTFGRDSKIKYAESKTPGPGSYTLKPTFADVPKYLLPNQN